MCTNKVNELGLRCVLNALIPEAVMINWETQSSFAVVSRSFQSSLAISRTFSEKNGATKRTTNLKRQNWFAEVGSKNTQREFERVLGLMFSETEHRSYMCMISVDHPSSQVLSEITSQRQHNPFYGYFCSYIKILRLHLRLFLLLNSKQTCRRPADTGALSGHVLGFFLRPLNTTYTGGIFGLSSVGS